MKKYLSFLLAGLGTLVLTGGIAHAQSTNQFRLAESGGDYGDQDYDPSYNNPGYQNNYGNYNYNPYPGYNNYPGNGYNYRNGNYGNYTINNNGVPGVPDQDIARVLGMNVNDYRNQINNGKTLPDMIRDRGMTMQQFQQELSRAYGYGRGYGYNRGYGYGNMYGNGYGYPYGGYNNYQNYRNYNNGYYDYYNNGSWPWM